MQYYTSPQQQYYSISPHYSPHAPRGYLRGRGPGSGSITAPDDYDMTAMARGSLVPPYSGSAPSMQSNGNGNGIGNGVAPTHSSSLPPSHAHAQPQAATLSTLSSHRALSSSHDSLSLADGSPSSLPRSVGPFSSSSPPPVESQPVSNTSSATTTPLVHVRVLPA